MNNTNCRYGFLTLLFVCQFFVLTHAQKETNSLPEEATFKDSKSKLWINTYGNIRVSKKLFWVAQTHFRFQETEQTPYIGQVAQIYNRHALGYIVSKKFNISLGGVLRLNYNTNPSLEAKNLVPEWRIWHQYQFAIPVSSAVVYHRIRLEHRWSKGFNPASEYIYRNRYRYMLRIKQPLNKSKLQSKTFYIAPEAELIMQSGKAVVASPLEDLRLNTSLGYIFNPQLTVATALMYSTGQTLENGGNYKQAWTIRLHLYYSPDFRKVQNRIPEIHFRD